MSAVENKILCFDMDAETVVIKEVGEADAVFSTLTLLEDGRFVSIDQKGRIYILAEDLGSWEVCDSETGGNAASYADSICVNHKVFFSG